MSENDMMIQRLKEAFKVLQSKGACGTQYETANVLGYTASSFSQIINGRVPVSEKFLRKLKSLDANLEKELNIDYIKTGEGELMTERRVPVTIVININNGNDSIFQSDINISGGSAVSALKMQIHFMERLLNEKENSLKEKDAIISEKDNTIREKERMIQYLMNKNENL